MKAYTPDTGKGATSSGHDIHHKTADLNPHIRRSIAKSKRHAARQHSRKIIKNDIQP